MIVLIKKLQLKMKLFFTYNETDYQQKFKSFHKINSKFAIKLKEIKL